MYHILFYTDMNDNRAVWQVKLCTLTIAELFYGSPDSSNPVRYEKPECTSFLRTSQDFEHTNPDLRSFVLIPVQKE